MRRVSTVVLLALLLVVAFGWAVSGQGVGTGTFEPFAIQVKHQEPVTVAISTTTASGEVVSVTVPISIDVDLRINVTGPAVASVEPGGATASEVTVLIAEPQPDPQVVGGFLDSSGRAYTVEESEALSIGQVQSDDFLTGAQVFGQITNETESTLSLVTISVQFFDSDGVMLGVDAGFPQTGDIEPGQTSPFVVHSQVPLDDVASYIVQTNR